MAEAMLEDSFKSSHPDLVACDSEEAEERKLLRSLSSTRDMSKEVETVGGSGGQEDRGSTNTGVGGGACGEHQEDSSHSVHSTEQQGRKNDMSNDDNNSNSSKGSANEKHDYSTTNTNMNGTITPRRIKNGHCHTIAAATTTTANASTSTAVTSISNIRTSPLKDTSSDPVRTRKKSVDFTFHPQRHNQGHRRLGHAGDGGGEQQPQDGREHNIHHHQHHHSHDEEPPPNKRIRTSSYDPWTPKQIVEAISTCIATQERLEAVEKARDGFDHDIQQIHDEEMAAGADAALAKHLTFIVYQEHNGSPQLQQYNGVCPKSTILTELSMTVDAMESLYRASSEIVGASFRRMGNHILQILLRVIEDEIQRRVHVQVVPVLTTAVPSFTSKIASCSNPNACGSMMKQEVDSHGEEESDVHDADTACIDNTSPKNSSMPNSPDSLGSGHPSPPVVQTQQQQKQIIVQPGTYEGDTLIRKATKIIGHFARVGNNTRDLAHFPGLLACLIRLITLKPYDCIPWEARLSSLWTIANLACNTDNMCMMVCSPGLVDSLVEVASRPVHAGDDLETIMELLRSRSIASRAILNLSWAAQNKMLLAEHSAVVDLLAELAVYRTAPLLSSRTVRQILVTTRRHAVAGIRNLAAAPRRTKLGLVQYKRGHLLDVLSDAALNDTDLNCRESAFAAIHNLAIQDTAQTMVQHPELVLALRGVLGSTEESDSKQHAAGTLLVLQRTITPEMEHSYEILRDLVRTVNPSPTEVEENDEEEDLCGVVNATAAV